MSGLGAERLLAFLRERRFKVRADMYHLTCARYLVEIKLKARYVWQCLFLMLRHYDSRG